MYIRYRAKPIRLTEPIYSLRGLPEEVFIPLSTIIRKIDARTYRSTLRWNIAPPRDFWFRTVGYNSTEMASMSGLLCNVFYSSFSTFCGADSSLYRCVQRLEFFHFGSIYHTPCYKRNA